MAGGVSKQTLSIEYGMLQSRAAPRYLRGIQDQVFNSLPTLKQFAMKVPRVAFAGGQRYMFVVDLSKGTGDLSYSDLDTVQTARLDTETIGQIETKEYFAPAARSFRERDLHRGNLAVVDDAWAETLSKAMRRIADQLNSHIITDDGTGNSSKRLTGLPLWVAADPTAGTAAGISRVNNSDWRSTTVNNSNTIGNLLLNCRSLTTTLTFGNESPDLILGNEAFRNALEGRYTNDLNHNLPVGRSAGEVVSGDGSVGMLFWRGIPVVCDKDWSQYGTSTGTGEAAFLRKDSFRLLQASSRASTDGLFEFVERQRAPFQTAEQAGVRAHLQLVCKELRKNGLLMNVGADAA